MIINSLLDTDLYKLTMMQGVLHRFPDAWVEYEFKCRDHTDLRPILGEVREEISRLCGLRFHAEELDFLRTLHYIKEDFIQFLRLFQLNEEFVSAGIEKDEFVLRINGPWLHTILYEVPLLAIINEVYFRRNHPNPDYESGLKKLYEKIGYARSANAEGLEFHFVDFGTRRRFSFDWHDRIIRILNQEIPESFVGSSNVYFAKKYGLAPVGTMAHEWLMALQSLGTSLAESQKSALDHWAREYRGYLGIALSDVVGLKAFLNDFDMYFAKLYDGCRHDSGDPFWWGDMLIEHYRKLGIDPMSKRAVFSDGLTFPKAVEIAKYFKGKIQASFGIGTNLTNDVSGKSIQIVIKMTKCQGAPVAKISDSSGKQMCMDCEFLDYLRKVFRISREDSE